MQEANKLVEFLKKNKPLINVNDLSKKANVNQRLRRYILGLVSYFEDTKAVNMELVKLYESLGKYLTENKIIEPKGLFK